MCHLLPYKVNTSLNDYNEKELSDELEDDEALEDDDLHLAVEDRQHLKHNFRAFNPKSGHE